MALTTQIIILIVLQNGHQTQKRRRRKTRVTLHYSNMLNWHFIISALTTYDKRISLI